MAYTFTTPNLGFPPIATTIAATTGITQGATTVYPATAVGRIPGPRLLQEANAYDPTYGNGTFVYLLGLAATAIGTWVTYNQDDGSTTLLVANAIGPVAIAMSANVAGQYGWYQIEGKAVGLVLASFADNANVYGTATPGSVDDAIVAGDRVQNCKGASAIGTPSGSFAEMEIYRPFVNDALAD